MRIRSCLWAGCQAGTRRAGHGEYGLPQGLIWSIVQDRLGFLWFATKDGLVRYDGYEHLVFRHDAADTSSLCESHVTSLFEDSKGYIWIGADSKGVDRYDPSTGRFEHLRTTDRKGAIPTVVNIKEHPNGDIWVHGFFATVFVARASEMQDGGAPLLRRIEEVYPLVDVTGLRDMEIAPNGDVWLLRKRSLGVHHIGESGTVVLKDQPISWPVDDGAFFPELVFNAASQRVLLVWDDNLVRFSSATGAVVDTLRLPTYQKRESRLFLDPHDRLWGLTGTGSWFRMDMASGASTHLQPVLDSGLPLSMSWFGSWAMDRTGILWCGTTGHGLVKYDPRAERFRTWTEETDGLGCTELVRADAAGTMIVNADEFKELHHQWAAPRSVGLAEVIREHGLTADWKRCVRDPQGRYWFCGMQRNSTIRHLHRYDPKDGTVVAVTKEKDDHYINIFPGMGDQIWISSGSAATHEDTLLTCFDTRNERVLAEYSYPGPVKRSTRRGIAAFEIADDGSIWIGSDFGVYALQPSTGTWRTFNSYPMVRESPVPS